MLKTLPPGLSALQEGTCIWAIGLMSGTSRDGIDAAFLKTDGVSIAAYGGWCTLPYTTAFQRELADIIDPATPEECISPVTASLTNLHADVVAELRQRQPKITPELIGFHGHTLWHRPPQWGHATYGTTRQIGDGPLLARLTGCPVVYDFRQNDMRYGGQGAPLVPLFHAALWRRQPRAAVFLNIGGVANLTYVPAGYDENYDAIMAMDTGPGNALINDWMQRMTGKSYDPEGSYAVRGQVHSNLVEDCLTNPQFMRKPPRSFDRDAFAMNQWQQKILDNLTPEDGAATLTMLTVQSIVAAAKLLPEIPEAWWVTGGGVHNRTMLNLLQSALQDIQPQAIIRPLQDLGCSPDACEAYAFAYLAARTVRGLPLSLPGTTGAIKPVTGGELTF